jgi:hypothetical protein
MEASTTSHELLGYFDGEDPSGSRAVTEGVRTRGVRWVLQWATAFAVLLFATSVFIEFAYLLAAEHTLLRAARAGALEATLPRATRESVANSVERRLADYPLRNGDWQLVLAQNGVPVQRAIQPRGGDMISVALAAPEDAILPVWLRRIKPWRHTGSIEVRAERKIPGRSPR